MEFRHWLCLLFQCAAIHAWALPARAAPPVPVEQEGEAQPEIVVLGDRRGGSAPLAPERLLDERDVAAYGAGTLAELLGAIQAQTRGSAGRPLVLVDGRRISSFSEVADLPPEAVQRVEILPEEAALRHGYRPGSRLVNIVLRPRYAARVAEAGAALATEGGRSTVDGSFTIARTGARGRWNLTAAARADMLLESERRLEGAAPGSDRALLPSLSHYSIGATVLRQLSGGTAATVTGRIEERSGRARLGPSAPGARVPLERFNRTRAVRAGANASGSFRSWQWLASALADAAWSRSSIDLPAPGGGSRHRTWLSSRDLNLSGLLSGSIAEAPAGEVALSLGIGYDHGRYRSWSLSAAAASSVLLRRRRAAATVNLDLPLSRRGSETAPLGNLFLNLNAELAHVSRLGATHGLGAGLTWSPLRPLTLSASISREEQLPTMQELGEPAIFLPNGFAFDFARGESVEVELVEGGDPALAVARRQLVRIALSLRPLRRSDLAFTAEFTATETERPIGAPPPPSAEAEAAFPNRYLRDASGRLVRIDLRPVNFLGAARRQLRWGAVWSLDVDGAEQVEQPGGDAPDLAEARRIAAAADRNQGRVQLSFHHTITLRDELRLAAGVPALDFLNGAALGAAGGRPRHELEAQAVYHRSGIGVRLDAVHRSGTTVITRLARAADRFLDYQSFTRFDLRLFADSGDRPALRRAAPWLGATRISLELTNLFDARPRVRDDSGRAPPGLRPHYLEPLGRSLRLSLRRPF